MNRAIETLGWVIVVVGSVLTAAMAFAWVKTGVAGFALPLVEFAVTAVLGYGIVLLGRDWR